MKEYSLKLDLFLKRIWDICFSLFGLLLFLPLWLLIPLAIFLEDGRPIFYSHSRITEHKRQYKHFKFRSMFKGAEDGVGPVMSAKEDQRITRVGRVLRVTALDELPQLINILRGDMSFVGPRSERPFFVEKLLKEIPNYEKRFAIKAGLTGVAQVYGKHDTSPEKKLALDLEYINQTSFFLDLKLIFLSLWITLKAGWERFEPK